MPCFFGFHPSPSLRRIRGGLVCLRCGRTLRTATVDDLRLYMGMYVLFWTIISIIITRCK